LATKCISAHAEKGSPIVVDIATYRNLPALNRAILHLMVRRGEAVVIDEEGEKVPVVQESAGEATPAGKTRAPPPDIGVIR